MPRFAGVDIPRNKVIGVSLTYIYGIGPTTAKNILAACGIDENTRTNDLTDAQETAIREKIDAIKTEGDLRRDRALDIKRLMKSVHTVESVIEEDYQFADNVHVQTLVQEKVHVVLSLIRRSNRRV